MSLIPTHPTLYTLDDACGLDMRYLMSLKTADIDVHIVTQLPDFLIQLNPHCMFPFYVDRWLALWGHALRSYLEERFPAPALLPQDLLQRAQVRLIAQEIREATAQLTAAKQNVFNARTPLGTIAEMESVYDPDQFWLMSKSMTEADASMMVLLESAHKAGIWQPSGSAFAGFYKKLRKTAPFMRALGH